MKNKNPIILTFIRYYLPGYKSGGPVRTIANLVDHLGDEFNFCIITSDRDVLDDVPYPAVRVDVWSRVGKANVYYTSPGRRSVRALAQLITDTAHDVIYLNSFLDPVFTLKPLLARRLGWIPTQPVVIAPRGEFSAGALALKHWKKGPYMAATHLVGLYQELTWQASSEHERANIESIMGSTATDILVASNLAAVHSSLKVYAVPRETTVPLRVVFLSRISPMKNLEFALTVLAKVRQPVVFEIFGPIRDEPYWLRCRRLLDRIPPHIRIEYRGSVAPEQVPEIMAAHDLFFLPTRGENYGHVIAEALSAGTPVLIADTTPWRNLEQAGVGWDWPLIQEERFIDSISYCAQMPAADYSAWRDRIRAYARTKLAEGDLVEANRRLFRCALGQTDNQVED